MQLKSLSLLNFKNFSDASMEFSSRVNCFLGDNGEGKTNLLDSIFYLAFCKSYFNPADSQNIKNQEGFMVVQGEFDMEGEAEKIYCGIKKGQKKVFKRNKKEYEKLSDHIGFIPMVMISPSDSALILEGSDVRRKFLDLIISQFDKSYLENVISYNRALSQRNSLLKKFMENRTFDAQSLEVWDEQLIRYGEPVFKSRKVFVEDFGPLFQVYYQNISNQKEGVSLIYDSQLNGKKLSELLQEHREKDRRMTHSTAGIHKDDLQFMINGFPIKKFGSQGQQKTYLLALKLAQAEYLKKVKGIKPILLLDDIYEKLDEKRITKLMDIVNSEIFSQVFITDTDTERIPGIFEDLGTKASVFIIQNGEIA